MEESDTGCIVCPECGKKMHVHYLTPDTAFLDMIFHFMNSHENIDPLNLLDNTEIDTTRGLISNGV